MGHLGLVVTLSLIPIIFNDAQFNYYPSPYASFPRLPLLNNYPLTYSIPGPTFTTTFNPLSMGNR